MEIYREERSEQWQESEKGEVGQQCRTFRPTLLPVLRAIDKGDTHFRARALLQLQCNKNTLTPLLRMPCIVLQDWTDVVRAMDAEDRSQRLIVGEIRRKMYPRQTEQIRKCSSP